VRKDDSAGYLLDGNCENCKVCEVPPPLSANRQMKSNGSRFRFAVAVGTLLRPATVAAGLPGRLGWYDQAGIIRRSQGLRTTAWGRLGEGEIGRRGEGEIGRLGDKENLSRSESPPLHVSLSPCLPLSPSPCLPLFPSPCAVRFADCQPGCRCVTFFWTNSIEPGRPASRLGRVPSVETW